MTEDRRAIVRLVLGGAKLADLSPNQRRTASRMIADGQLRVIGDRYAVTPATLTAIRETK